jgi:hypothetical protein
LSEVKIRPQIKPAGASLGPRGKWSQAASLGAYFQNNSDSWDQPFLISDQERVLCGPNGVGRWRWVFSGGPACLVVVVGVAVSQNYGTVVVWCSAAFQPSK